MTTHEVLVAARNLIDREGHFRGFNFLQQEPGYCVHQAIGVAGACWRLEIDGASNLMLDMGATPEWNDAPGRTKEEVLAAFDKAIAATAPSPADPLAGKVELVEEPVHA